MRGSFSYDDVMFKITSEDKKIISNIIEENLETTKNTHLPFI
jgi:hypothetical protein